MNKKIVYQDKHRVADEVEAKAILMAAAWNCFPTHEKFNSITGKANDLPRQGNGSHWITNQNQLEARFAENRKRGMASFVFPILSAVAIKETAIDAGKASPVATGRMRERVEAPRIPVQYVERFSDVEAWLTRLHSKA